MVEKGYLTLGTNVIPESYSITFETDIKTFRFTGSEEILARVRKPTSSIRLNARDLKILGAEVEAAGTIRAARVGISRKRKEITLGLGEKVSGRVAIRIRFSGVNNEKMDGFYRSRYVSGKKEGSILSSQFEAADARAAFPCFDEPSFKATFSISIIADEGLEAVSNMPVKRITAAGKSRMRFDFQTTPRMSTYLVYLGVGRFESVTGSIGRLKLRVLTVPGKRSLAHLPLRYAKEFIKFFESYFGIRYPLPKLDLIAVPDFSAGAMENWGAMTFREIALLGDEKATPIAMRQQIAETVAHEIAHQWFGDLVTMRWWDDTWLNESFATFMANKALDAVYPEWEMKKQYLDDVISTAFSADALRSTHPVSVHVSTPEEIDQLFDAISYEKGGTVLHMLETYVGKEPFRKGLHLYLKRHAYSNATKYDLWSAISRASPGKHADKFASSWIDLPGYPIIEVDGEERGRDTALRLRQRRFLISSRGAGGGKGQWSLPLECQLDGNRRVTSLLDSPQLRLATGGARWAKFNYGQHYLYRVRYPGWMLRRLGVLMRSGRLRGADSWGIENDLFALARSGAIRIGEYLDFIESYCMDPDYPLAFSISSHLAWLQLMLDSKGPVQRLSEISMRYHLGALGRLGWKRRSGEPSLDTMFRSDAISSLGRLGHKATVSKALSLFSAYLRGNPIEPDIRAAVYGLAAWTGDMARFKRMVSLYKKETVPDDKRRLLQSLAMFRDRAVINAVLRFAYTRDVRLQDSYVLPAIVSSNPVGRHMIWKWTRKNWKALMPMYDSGTHMLDRFVTNLSSSSDPEERRQIAAFFAIGSNMRGDLKLRTRQSLERIDANINFMKANGLS